MIRTLIFVCVCVWIRLVQAKEMNDDGNERKTVYSLSVLKQQTNGYKMKISGSTFCFWNIVKRVTKSDDDDDDEWEKKKKK